MEFEVRVRLTTNFLGSGPRKNGVRKLLRNKQGLILLPVSDLNKDIDKIRENLSLNTDHQITLQEDLDPPRINILRRVYNKVRVERIEGIESKTYLSIYCHCEEDYVNELTILFKELGKKYGISQWGRKFNCGRFKLVSILIRKS